MKKLLFLLGLFSLPVIGISQNGYPISSISSEIITSQGLTKLPPESNAIPAGKNGDLDIDDRFYYQLRNEYVSDPSQILPLSCFVKQIEYIVRFKNDVYGPFIIKDEIPQGQPDGTRFSTTPRDLLKKVQTEVLDKINSRNINDLQIIFKGVWYTKAELDSLKPQCNTIDQIKKDETRVDVFNLSIKDYGLIALVDVSPLSKEGAQLSLDVVSGFFKDLSRTSIDYVSVVNKPAFANAMVSTPFLRYEGRNFFTKNFCMESVFVMDLVDKTKPIAFGVGIGAIGEKNKVFKAGIFWNNTPNYYVGISLVGLAGWLANYK